MTAVDPVDGAGFSIFGSTSFGRITPLEAPSLSLSVPGCLVNVLFGLGETVRAPGSFAAAACDGAIASTAKQPAAAHAANSVIFLVIDESSYFDPRHGSPFH